MRTSRMYNLYYVDDGSQVRELYEVKKNEFIRGIEEMIDAMDISGKELMKLLHVPEEYVDLLCTVFRISKNHKVYAIRLKDVVREMKQTRIYKEEISREEIVERFLREKTGISLDELREIIREIIENIEPPE